MALASAEYVPFCTCRAGGERVLRLRGTAVDLLESERFEARKVVLLGVLHVEDEGEDHLNGERGLYISTNAETVRDQDASALVLILRGVDLQQEPFWGSLLLLLSSHLFVARTGPLTSASFHTMAFLSDFLQIQVVNDGKPEDNALLLKEMVPKFTWAAIDLKQKDMEGCESPSKYFELKLTNPSSKHGFDVDAQMLMNGYLHSRDCIVLKSNSLQTPPGFAGPQAFTSQKILTHALESAQPKVFFGRYLNGALVLHLTRSVANVISTRDSKLVLQRVVNNVLVNYWKGLVNSAFGKYSDVIHARLGTYEKVTFDAEYLLDITERKLQTQQVAVVNAGQGKFSSFDEFGNLKRQTSVDNPLDGNSNGAVNSTASPSGGSTLNTGIFTFLKERAERAFTKQFSLFDNMSMSGPRKGVGGGGGGELSHIAENDGDEDDGDATNAPQGNKQDTPDELLARLNAPIKAYSVPMEYMNMPSEAMPVDHSMLENIHREALDEAQAIIAPFLFDLKVSTSTKYSELTCTLNFHIGKTNLFRRIQRVKVRFERANEAASALFCAELARYLHSIVLRKNERDKEQKLSDTPRLRRNTTSIIYIPGGKDTDPPLTKLPFELLTYKNNLEAMVSQYHFVARGPFASKILIGFFQTTVRTRLLELAKNEYERFDRVCDMKREKLEQLEESLQLKQQSVEQVQQTNAELSLQEAQLVAEIDAAHREQVRKLESEIQSATDMVDRALRDQQALYQSTMLATRKTINTMDQVAVKNRVFVGYLKRFEKGHLFSKSWRQYYYVLDHSELTCYESKSAYEERKPPFEPPISLTGYNVVKSRTDEMKIKLIPPEAGQMLRFRAPVSVGRETWMKRFIDATQL
ncbi:hypothetical protein FI667_g4535, partial [Globisporangium splendens]